jgi:hypothetical protein
MRGVEVEAPGSGESGAMTPNEEFQGNMDRTQVEVT